MTTRPPGPSVQPDAGLGAPTIRPAGAGDREVVEALANQYLAWLHEHYGRAGIGWIVDRYYPPEKWAALLASLPSLHRPPDGDILLARQGADALGCGMMDRLDHDACEMKRLFVPSAYRGRGVGRALALALMELSAARGYRTMRLDTANADAVRLYEALGFRRIEPFRDCPADLLPVLTFMEADLTR